MKLLSLPACEPPRLYAYLVVYRVYPQIRDSLSSEWGRFLAQAMEDQSEDISRSLTGKSHSSLQNNDLQIARSLTAKSADAPATDEILRSSTGESSLSASLLLERLSYTHLELLASLDSPSERAFYEIECIKGGWSVRELKRQIASLYHERSGLSLDKNALARLANEAAESQASALVIRDPFVFEFLGLRPQEVLPESDLEAALLANLENFLLELGHGFCFEARQKRLLIGGEHFFVDLVFYHRVLKCHLLVELKVDEFRHEHLGQLNAYVSCYRAQEMTAGDQPPVGLLLCTGKNHALVEYTLAGMDNRLFVSKYQLELPRTDELQRYLDEQRRRLEGARS